MTRAVPQGACDCHGHVFASPEQFPLAHPPSYPVPLATMAQRLAAGDAVGISRAIAVQASPYGTDPAALVDALVRSGGRMRGVAVADGGTDENLLGTWGEEGVRALRFVESRLPDGRRFNGSIGLDAFEPLQSAMRDLGWHAELWGPLAETLAAWDRITASKLPIVLDHMGGFDARLGPEHADFRRLVDLVRDGQAWVKLVLCRRVPPGGSLHDLRPFHDALIEANPDRLLWGSDWPFVRMENPPAVETLLDLFLQWVDDEALARRILAENPQARYGFAVPG